MRATMSMVLDILRESFPVGEGVRYDPDAEVSVIREGIPPDRRPGGSCVIVIGGDPEEAPSEAFGCRTVAVCPPGTAFPVGCALHVSTGESTSTVVDALEKGLSRYKRVLDRLTDLALRGADANDLAECAHELLQNPLLIHDAALRVRARTERDSINKEVWKPIGASGQASRERVVPESLPEFIDLIERDGEVAGFRTPSGIIIHSVRTRKIAGAYLVVSLLQKNRSVTEGDRAILRMLSALIEMGMKTNVRLMKEELGYNGLLLDALEGRMTDFVEFSNRMAALGHNLRPIANIMLVSPLKGEFSDRQAQRIIEEIGNTFSFGRGVRYRDALVFYETYENASVITSADYSRLAAFLERFKMVAALGNPQPSERMVAGLYLGASLNMRVGRRLYPGRSLLFPKDCQPYWAYETCLRQGNPDLYVHPALNALREYDLSTGGGLFEVLKRFSLNRGNKSTTAAEEHIQRNTLQARLREIEVVCKVDLSDPSTLNHLRRSFVLEDYCSGRLRMPEDGGAS